MGSSYTARIDDQPINSRNSIDSENVRAGSLLDKDREAGRQEKSVADGQADVPARGMAIDQPETIDAAGSDRETGEYVLTIVDSWDWADEPSHLAAIQAKLNAYFGFVESGQIAELEPAWQQVGTRIDVLFRVTPTDRALALLQTAEFVARPFGLKISHRMHA